MTEELLRATLEAAQAKTDPEGWTTLPEGRTITLYAAHEGAPLTVAKIVALRVTHSVLRARTIKGETFFLSMPDVFATAIDGGTDTSVPRKTGFLG